MKLKGKKLLYSKISILIEKLLNIIDLIWFEISCWFDIYSLLIFLGMVILLETPCLVMVSGYYWLMCSYLIGLGLLFIMADRE